MDDIIHFIPEKYRGTLLFLIAISPYLTRAYHALRNGGGLKGIINAVWCGTNTDPKLKAEIEELRSATSVITKP